MSPSDLFRWCGIGGIISGICVIIGNVLPGTTLLIRIITMLGPALGLFLLTGVYLRQRPQSGKLGFIGYVVHFFGMTLVVAMGYMGAFIFPYVAESVSTPLYEGTLGIAVLVTLQIFLLGVILFSIATIKANVLPRPASILYLIGFIPTGFGLFLPEIVNIVGHVIGGVGIIWWGYALYKTGQAEPAAAPHLAVGT